jgi:lysophospholipase L1-like esterase
VSILIHGGERVVGVGDSITANGLWEVSTGLVDQINTQIIIPARPYAGVVSGVQGTLKAGAFAATVRNVVVQNPVIYTNSGVAGNQTSDIAANVATRITNYNPNVIILLIGINDVINSVPLGTSTTNYTSILTQIRAWSSTVQIGIVSLLTYGSEQWSSGPPLAWAVNATNTAIAAFNAMEQGLAVTYNATYLNLRDPLLVWESQNNTPEPGSVNGPYAGGGPHPTVPTSEVLTATWALPYFNVVPL